MSARALSSGHRLNVLGKTRFRQPRTRFQKELKSTKTRIYALRVRDGSIANVSRWALWTEQRERRSGSQKGKLKAEIDRQSVQ